MQKITYKFSACFGILAIFSGFMYLVTSTGSLNGWALLAGLSMAVAAVMVTLEEREISD